MAVAKLHQRLLLLAAAGAVLFTPGLAVAAPPGPAVVDGSPAAYAGAFVRACGSNANSSQTTTSGSFQDLGNCTLNVGGSGHVLVLANVSAGLVYGSDTYEANFRIDHNSGLTGDDRTDRTVDVYPDYGDGTDRVAAITAMYTVTAGLHTFALLYQRTEGSASVKTYDATLSVLFVPDGLDLIVCGDMPGGLWTATTTFNPTVKCSINAPKDGLVFVSADGWMSLDAPASPRFEALHVLAMDGDTDGEHGLRYTDVYTNTGDGMDATMATTEVFSVTPGLHEFKLYMKRQGGTGTVRMVDAALAALYVPFDSPYVQVCGGHTPDTYHNDTTTYSSLIDCTLDVPVDSWAFVSGTAGVAHQAAGDNFEAAFGLAQDGTFPLNPTSRYVNIAPDAGDGTDASVADSLLMPLDAGTHTFALVGKRQSGTGEVLGHYPVMFVLAPGANLFVPLVRR